MRGPGIEPGSTAWKAAMLTITPATLSSLHNKNKKIIEKIKRKKKKKKKNLANPSFDLGTFRL